MGLTPFALIAVIAIFGLIFRVRGGGSAAWAFRVGAFASAAYGAAVVAAYLVAAYRRDVATILVRAAGAAASVSYLAYLRMALIYPNRKLSVFTDAMFIVVASIVASTFALTDLYVVDARRITLDFVIFEGGAYDAMTALLGAMGLAAAVLTAVKAFIEKRPVFRQHLAVMAAGLAAWTAWDFAAFLSAPSLASGPIYPLSALGGLFSAAAVSYALSSTRTFHVGKSARLLGSWGALAAFFALPAGIAAGAALLLREAAPTTAVFAALAVFAVFGRWAESFAKGKLGTERDESAREDLESAIAHLDLSQGRGKALAELDAVMTEAFDCSWFQALSEDDEGNLRRAYPDDDSVATMAGSPLLEALSSVDRRAILKTDLEADPALAERKAALSLFLESLGAEAMVLAREGRRIIGVFALGPRRSGADYDALDYLALDAIHGKLFVVAYYARHVARESLLSTVEGEIGLADQIVKSVQERIDPIQHPGVSYAFRCESPRGLGGDLFDSVRLSEHRWFFVVGDVSGKGLTASMSMIILKAMIRTLLVEEKDFVALVAKTNSFIKDRLPRGTFFSGMFGFLALDKGSVYFINAGIPAMYLRSPGLDSIIETQGEGKMLGFVRDIAPYLKTRKLALPPGSRIVISTDGIIEAESVRGERYGKERLARVLGETRGASAAETIDAVVKSAAAFAGGKLDDDITVVAIDYDGPRAAGSKG